MFDSTIQQVCDYTNWAYTSYLDLSYASDFEYMRTDICPGFYQDMNLAMARIDSENEQLVTSSYLYKLSNNVHTTYSVPSYSTKTFKNYQTLDDYHMFAYASAVAASAISSAQVMPATELTFEVYSDNTVIGYFSDEAFTLIGCTEGEPCLAANFVAALKTKYRKDFETHCNETSAM